MLRFVQRPIQKARTSTALRTGLFALPMFALAVWMATGIQTTTPQQVLASVLPQQIQAQVINSKGVILSWSATDPSNESCYYVIERSNGVNYKNIACLKAEKNSLHYRFVDQSPAEGSNSYRITRTDFKGVHERSATCDVEFNYRRKELSQHK